MLDSQYYTFLHYPFELLCTSRNNIVVQKYNAVFHI